LPSENVAAEVARRVPGMDLIVYGHSHRQMADTVINGVLLVQPKNWAASVGVAELELANDGGAWRVASKRSLLIPAAGHAEDVSVMRAVAAGHEAARNYVATVIGSTDVRWSADSGRVMDTPLADLILDVERRTVHSDLASTAVFDVGARIDSGPITVGEIARLYPYENTLSAVRITGAQLRAYLEYSARYYGTFGTSEPPVHTDVPGYNFDVVSGADYTIDLSRPVGSRITSLSVRGKPVSDADSFTLALNNYRRSGGGGYAMLTDAPEVYTSTTEIRDLLIAEVERRKHISPRDYFLRNWSIVPAAAIPPAYRATHHYTQ
jgi:2',3'-cyclic-nucleotide 2'-phosphodiesterase (5'-nucleotidase family)